ncbi:hypothetical protein GALMADRAFT_1229155 [Galerina marginata CBS 339.88]|uniref:SET domain-containing protein n=1 Tax=Galerina marginata (strain CBS 339.88) TaxID=685588 RepID=A0A067TJS2_GALM3|nr:hypothetical protein GALMADRAFT_1229155 [Galerina marginata CBS 339.88]
MSAQLYDILPTLWGGRSAFSREAIPKGTPILFCSAPYANVIFWKFRREVCATCYAYATESGRSKWSIKLGEESRGAGGAWFCSDRCRDACIQENEIFKGQGIGWWLEINGAFERLVSQMGKGKKERSNPKLASKPNPASSFKLAFLDDISSVVITPEFLDRAWSIAEEISSEDSKNGWKTEWSELLTEFELDTARFVLDGLVRKVVEDVNPSSPILDRVSSNRVGFCVSAGRWSDLMGLQDNELALVRSKPYILGSRIRVYRFLRHLATSLLPRRKPHSGPGTPREGSPGPSAHIADELRNCLSTSAEARALMARDHGNVFGIWDMAAEDEGSEMLGWGAYIFGSYFNHGCAPNLKKSRDKRGMQFSTLRDVLPGEELCISYIDEESLSTQERSEHLERDWFFVCRCARCAHELDGVMGSNDG